MFPVCHLSCDEGKGEMQQDNGMEWNHSDLSFKTGTLSSELYGGQVAEADNNLEAVYVLFGSNKM